MNKRRKSDPGISVYHANVDADFITAANALALAKNYPVTVKINSYMLLKKLYTFS